MSAAPGRLLDNVVRFGRLLRAGGIPVHPTQLTTLARAVDHLDLGRREEVKDGFRAVLVQRREHWELFDRAFDLFWSRSRRADEPPAPGSVPLPARKRFAAAAVAPAAANERDRPPGGAESMIAERRFSYSPREALRRKDFAEMTAAELREVEVFLRRWPVRVEHRVTRRRTRAPSGSYLDLRRTVRRSLRYGGEPLHLAWQDRKKKPRPLVLLCDISGSMEPYARVLLQFLVAVAGAARQVESFAFGTRLTRLTRQLRQRDFDRALRDAAEAVVDWGGGTRIGEALRRFHHDWGRRVLGRGAVVVVISDGWDRGDVELLEREVARLHRSCHRLLWLNPLLGLPNYEPLTRGIRAVLPHVDEFLPVNDLDSLERLGRLLERLGSPALRGTGRA